MKYQRHLFKNVKNEQLLIVIVKLPIFSTVFLNYVFEFKNSC